jgi:hypothetical protein
MKYPWFYYLFAWPVLFAYPLVLAWLCWPWCYHVVSYFWISILLIVLADEALSYFFFPERKTISDHIREQHKKDPKRFWAMIIVCIFFWATLMGHFIVKGV